MMGFEGLGLRPESEKALVSYLAPKTRPANGRSRFVVFPGLDDVVEREVQREAASLLPALLPSLMRVALAGGQAEDPRALAMEVAAVRDRLNEAASRARADYLRENLRPALLDLATYLGGYDKTAACGRLPGEPKDWSHVSSTITRRMDRARRMYGELGIETTQPVPRPSRGPLERLMGRLKETLDRASEEVRILAVSPPPSTAEEAEAAWKRLAAACTPPLALARAIGKGLEKQKATSSAQGAVPQAAPDAA